MTKRNILIITCALFISILGLSTSTTSEVSAAPVRCGDGTTQDGPIYGTDEMQDRQRREICKNNGGLWSETSVETQQKDCTDRGGQWRDDRSCEFSTGATKTCGGAETSIISCEGEGQDAIFNVIKMIIQIMTISIGIVAVGAVIFGALLYGSSGDNPENIKKAKGIWMNVVIGLLLFGFLVTITNFLIPGGVF